MKSKVTLKDIAKIVGISTNSVSKALRGSGSISKETREKVEQIAESLGYIKDIHATTLRGGDSHVIAIVYDELLNPYYTSMLQVLTSQLNRTKYESMIFVDTYALGHISEITAKRIVSYGVTGVISFLLPTSGAKQILKNNGIPTVIVGRKGDKTETSSVYSNDYKGGKLAAYELVRLGGKSFLYVTEHSELEVNTKRLDGFKKGLAEKGFTLKNDHIAISNLEASLEETIKRAIDNDNTIDSVFCFSDINAFCTIEILTSLGYKIPEDINVIGYDNIKDYLTYPIRLSSIDSQREITTAAALELLRKQILNEDYEDPTYLKLEVVYSEGNTTKQK